MARLTYEQAKRIFERGRNPERGRPIGARARLIKLADSPDEQGPNIEWQYTGTRGMGPVYHGYGIEPDEPETLYQGGRAHPWIGKPGFAIRVHETVAVGIHPDNTWTVFHGGHTTQVTNRYIYRFAGVWFSGGSRWSARARTPMMHNRWFFPDWQRLVIDAEGSVIGALCALETRYAGGHPGMPEGGCLVGQEVELHEYRRGWTRDLERHLEYKADHAAREAKKKHEARLKARRKAYKAKKKGRGARIVAAFTGGPRR